MKYLETGLVAERSKQYIDRLTEVKSARRDTFGWMKDRLIDMSVELEEIEVEMLTKLIPELKDVELIRPRAKTEIGIVWQDKNNKLGAYGPYWKLTKYDDVTMQNKRPTKNVLRSIYKEEYAEQLLNNAVRMQELATRRNKLITVMSKILKLERSLPARSHIEFQSVRYPRENKMMYQLAQDRRAILLGFSKTLEQVLYQVEQLEKQIDEQSTLINQATKRRNNVISVSWRFLKTARSVYGISGPEAYHLRINGRGYRYKKKIKRITRDVLRTALQRRQEKVILPAATQIRELSKQREALLKPASDALMFISAGLKIINNWSE